MLLDLRIIISINYKCVVYARPYIEDLGGKCLLKHFDIVTNAKTTFYTKYCTLHVYTANIQIIQKNHK